MKAVSGKQFRKLLEARGWQLLRVNGSHFIYSKEGIQIRISVPLHGNSPLKMGLQRHLMKLAEIDQGEL